MLKHFRVTYCRMHWDFYIGRGGDYGDLVIWVGPFYVALAWSTNEKTPSA